MSNYRSMIDQALEAARARAHTPAETVKTASASDALVKEASDLANALEFISMSATGGDSSAGFRQEMIRDFYKAATSPAQGPTMASGVQGQAPSEGKKKLNPKGLVGGNSPAQSSTTPEAKDGQKTMLESFKQAESTSLYDVLMGNKTAGMDSPAQHDSEVGAGVTTANENSTYRQTLHTNEGPVNANKRDLKKNTRARLQEAFAHTSDTLGDATAAQIFPNAAAKGNLKIANAMASVGKGLKGMSGKILSVPSSSRATGKKVFLGGKMLGPATTKNSPISNALRSMSKKSSAELELEELLEKLAGRGKGNKRRRQQQRAERVRKKNLNRAQKRKRVAASRSAAIKAHESTPLTLGTAPPPSSPAQKIKQKADAAPKTPPKADAAPKTPPKADAAPKTPPMPRRMPTEAEVKAGKPDSPPPRAAFEFRPRPSNPAGSAAGSASDAASNKGFRKTISEAAEKFAPTAKKYAPHATGTALAAGTVLAGAKLLKSKQKKQNEASGEN